MLRGALKHPTTIPSPVDAVLAANCLSMTQNHPDRRTLGLDVLRAQVAAHRLVEARRSGDPTETPDRPAAMTPPNPAETLSAMHDRWVALFSPGRKARDDNRLYLNAFIGIYGDLPAAAVTRKMIRDFRELLRKRPRNMPADIAKLPLRDQVGWGETQQNCVFLTAQTVNAKGIGSLSAVLEAAKKDDLIEVNPCLGQLIPVKGHALDRLPYDVEDLNRIFATAIYTEGKRFAAGAGDAQFWMPLIALFAGARLEEIGQLLVEDIRTEGRIIYFDFIDIDDEAETAGTKSRPRMSRRKMGGAKCLCTRASSTWAFCTMSPA